MRNRTTWTPQVRAEFLEELSVLGSTASAAAAAGIAESVARYHRDTDPEFAEEWKAALARHDRSLMQQVRKMALDGVVVSVVKDADGRVVKEDRKFSERILVAYLRRMETGSWLDRVKVDNEHSGTVKHEHSGRIEVENLSPEQRRKARDFLASLN